MVCPSSTGDQPCCRVLNHLKSPEVAVSNTVEKTVAIVESAAHKRVGVWNPRMKPKLLSLLC